MEAPYFSAAGDKASTPGSPVDRVMRSYILSGLLVVLGILGTVFAVLYFAVLRSAPPLVLWSVVGAVGALLLFLAWKWFRDNGALLTAKAVS